MVSLELELAQGYLALTKKVYSTKIEELNQAKALVARLQEHVQQAEQDMHRAQTVMYRVERRLEVVDILDDTDKENHHHRVLPQNAGVALAPTHPFRGTKKRPLSPGPHPDHLVLCLNVLDGGTISKHLLHGSTRQEPAHEEGSCLRPPPRLQFPAHIRRKLKRQARRMKRILARRNHTEKNSDGSSLGSSCGSTEGSTNSVMAVMRDDTNNAIT